MRENDSEFIPEKRKKRKISPITIIFFCLVFALFAWSIWEAFLSPFVPRHRTYFKDYDSFLKKAGNDYLYLQLPESASDTKYYWGVDRFVTVAGYSTTLSDEDYEACKSDAIKQYQDEYKEWSNTEWYLYSEDNDKEWVQEEWLDGYSIEETEELLYKNEDISDYYILAFRYSNKDGPIAYFYCMLCNDSSGRIIEVSCVDRNPTVREINKSK